MSELSIFVTGIVAVYSYQFLGKVLRSWKRKRKDQAIYHTLPRAVPLDRNKLCEDHEWVQAVVAFRGLPAGEYDICKKCGAINGEKKLMFSSEAIEQVNEALHNQKVLQEANKKVEVQIQNETDKYLHDYVIKNFEQEINDPKMLKKLNNFVEYALSTRERVTRKVKKELEMKSDPEYQRNKKFYENTFWSTDSGNA